MRERKGRGSRGHQTARAGGTEDAEGTDGTGCIKILNVRLSGEMVSWLDSLVGRGLYKSRAEAIREFCREFVELHPPACRLGEAAPAGSPPEGAVP